MTPTIFTVKSVLPFLLVGLLALLGFAPAPCSAEGAVVRDPVLDLLIANGANLSALTPELEAKGNDLSNKAKLQLEQGDFKAAELTLSQLLDISIATFGESHLLPTFLKFSIGVLQIRAGGAKKGLETARLAMETCNEVSRPESKLCDIIQSGTIQALFMAGELPLALEENLRAASRLSSTINPHTNPIVLYWHNISLIYGMLSEPQRARQYAELANDFCAEIPFDPFGESTQICAIAKGTYAVSLLKSRETELAVRYAETSLAELKKIRDAFLALQNSEKTRR